jgi:hypothetical protein
MLPTTVEIPKFINSDLEGLFLRRSGKANILNTVRTELTNIEYEIALRACPFYLGQRLWFDDGVYPRARVYVSEISFTSREPYYEFWVTPEEGHRIRTTGRKTKGTLKHLAGVQNNFVESLPQYRERLTKLVASGKITLRPTHSSMDTPQIVTICASANRASKVNQNDIDWFYGIFSMKHTK